MFHTHLLSASRSCLAPLGALESCPDARLLSLLSRLPSNPKGPRILFTASGMLAFCVPASV